MFDERKHVHTNRILLSILQVVKWNLYFFQTFLDDGSALGVHAGFRRPNS